MEGFSVLIFILFLIGRILAQAQKQQQRNRGPIPRPRHREREQPWWEEREQTKPDQTRPEQVQPESTFKPTPMKLDKSIVQRKSRIEERRKEKVQPKAKAEQWDGSWNFDPEHIREGIIWAEILEAPKARKNQYRQRYK